MIYYNVYNMEWNFDINTNDDVEIEYMERKNINIIKGKVIKQTKGKYEVMTDISKTDQSYLGWTFKLRKFEKRKILSIKKI